MRTYDTRREAGIEGAKWEAEIARGQTADAGKLRLSDYLKEWLGRAAKRVRPSTFSDYQYTIEHYLLPQVGGLTLRQATPRAMQAILDKAPTAYLATKWRRHLHIAFEEAVTLNLVAQWTSLDLDTGTLTVKEAFPNVNGRRFEGPPKSDAGKRVLKLDPALLTVLKAHRVYQVEHQMLMGEQWRDHGLVCASEVGTPIGLTNLRRGFNKLIEQAGVPRIRLYDLRHTTTSIMLESGADLKATSEVLGHSDPGITQRIYQHVRPEQRERAVSLLASALAEEQPARVPGSGIEAVPPTS
jgi:integrase